MAEVSDDHFEAFVSACTRLLAPRPLAHPVSLTTDEERATLEVDTGFDRFKLRDCEGNLDWFRSAQRLGGLQVRVLATKYPSRIALFGSWELHTAVVTGIPEPLE